MLSLIEVKCPHCAAQGQIMLPPLGAIIVGPCPECQGMDAIFSGRVLALDTELMNQGSTTEKRGHLLEVLGGFIRDRVDRLFDNQPEEAEGPEFMSGDFSESHDLDEDNHTATGRIDPYGNNPSSNITVEEIESFKNVDLRLLDNKEYFKAVFE